MPSSQELTRHVASKNRLSNIMICLKAALDIIPQVLIIHMIGIAYSHSLSRNLILKDSGCILLCFALKAVCAYGAVWKAHEAAYNSLTELRLRIIAHLKKLPLGFFQERRAGELANIVQHDVEQAEVYLAHGLPEIMAAALLPVVIFVVMLALEWRLALLMIAGLPLMWLTRKISAPLWKKNFKIFTDSMRRMQGNLMEYVSNISVVKAFGKEERKTEETLRSAKDYVYWVKRSMAGVSVPMGLIDLFMESGVVLVMIFGSWLLSIDRLSVSRFVLAVILGAAFTSSIAKTATFQHYRIVFNQAMSCVGSILNVPAPQSRAADAAAANGDIEIRRLSFAYKGKRDTLKDIDLTFRKGSRNALVGASGCGKSTLAHLLMGFWRPGAGTISIAGRDIQELSEKQLNSLFSIVQQEVFLFNLSLKENILIGNPNASDEEIVSAARKARLHDFIMSLPRGYDTAVGEAGVKFSGGEKQRLSIARAILKNAPIIVLDEATAAVDAENEACIQAAIADLNREKTIITIAHHLNAIRNADQIAVMDDGALIDSGTHAELMERCALYREMVCAQNKVDNWNIKEA